MTQWPTSLPGGYSPNFRVGLCCWNPRSLTLTKKSFKWYPVSDSKQEKHNLFLTNFVAYFTENMLYTSAIVLKDITSMWAKYLKCHICFRIQPFAKPFILNLYKFVTLLLTWNMFSIPCTWQKRLENHTLDSNTYMYLYNGYMQVLTPHPHLGPPVWVCMYVCMGRRGRRSSRARSIDSIPE